MDRTQQLEKIYDNFLCSFTIKPNGEIVDYNNIFKSLLYFQEPPRSIYELVSDEFGDDYHERLIEHVMSGYPWRDEIRFSYGDALFWLDVQIITQETEDDVYITYMGVDLTNRKKNEELIKEQQRQIFTQSQFSALGEMASGVAHEINNPLSILSASSFLLKTLATKKEPKPETLMKLSEDIEKTVIRISSIIQGLRNIARDPTKEEFEVTNFGRIMNDVLPICSEKFKSNGIDLQVDYGEGLDELPLRLLPVQMSQIILNLLNNSYDEIKEKEYDSPWILIKLCVDKKNDNFIIEVRDCGNGIPQEIQDVIFNPFFTQKEIGKGTGLGLSLSQSMVRRHGGSLKINNESDNTSFKILLPLTIQANEEGSCE